MVSHFLSILLSSLMFLQSINIHLVDFSRMEALMEHAQFHAEEYGDDWFSFLDKHYGDSSEEHIDSQHKDKHRELPKHDHLCASSIPVFILSSKLSFKLKADRQGDEKVNFLYIEAQTSLLEEEIFQPPKYA